MIHLLLILLSPALLVGCREKYQARLPTTQMKIGEQTFTLEVADDPVEKQIGLMRRDSMPAQWGMIFVFAGDQKRQFHMENTRIPLDILFLDRDGRVVAVKQMKPYNDRATSDAPARYAIELNQGTAARIGVKRGDVLTLPEDIKALTPVD